MAIDNFENYNQSIFDSVGDEVKAEFSNPILADLNAEDSGAEELTQTATQIPSDPSEIFAYDNSEDQNGWLGQGFIDEETPEIYRSQEFEEAVSMYFDIHDRTVTKYLSSLNEADQTSLLRSLTSKLYDIIVKKIDKIDYGDIPKTKGDITKVQNYNMTCECIDLIRDIVNQFHEDPEAIETINSAIINVSKRTSTFNRAYMKKNGFVTNLYCNTVLAIIASTSYMVSTCIEFIKTPAEDTFEITLDKVAYVKSKDALLLNTLRDFNKSCKSGDFDKACDAAMSNKLNEGAAFGGLLATATSALGLAAGPVGVITGVAFILVCGLPILRNLAYYFFSARTRFSDYLEIQANILEAHALKLQSSDSDIKNKDKVVERQLKIVERFRKIANVFAITNKKAEVDTYKTTSDEDKSINPSDLDPSPSVLF